MQTLFLGKEQVVAYLSDLQRRLLALGDQGPAIWVPLGYSGAALLNEVFSVASDISDASPVIIEAKCRRDPKTRAMQVTWGESSAQEAPAKQLAGKRVMVIDSAVHSGSTMAAAVRAITQAGAAGVCSYSLVLKESSAFIPSYWAVSIADEDRAYFLLPSIPNNRFVSPVASSDDDTTEDGLANALPEATKGRLPYFSVRKLSHHDIGKPKFEVKLASLNRSNWADLYYQMRNSPGACTYLLELGGNVAGYITLEMPAETELSIEQVATHPDQEGKGYAAALLRWAETLGRLKNCTHLRLWAIAHRESWYAKHGFRRTPDEPLDLGDEKYVRMRKCLLPHTGCCPHPHTTSDLPEVPAVEKP
jgi:GNAT superfamily N-acetyltransferase/hypoxanthine phosphoribosyltransferase